MIVPLTGDKLVVGRSREARIFLEDDGASRRHAELFRDPFGRWWVRDLHSRNGTLVNGFVVNERMLDLGDQIQIGATTLTLALMSAESLSPQDGDSSQSAARMAVRDAAAAERITTLEPGEEPKLSAGHLTTLMALGQRLANIENMAERHRLLCSLLVSPQFGGRSAVVIRVARDDASKPPRTLCPPQHAPQWSGQSLYISTSLLEAMRKRPAPMLASEADPQASAASGIAISPSTPEAAAMSAMACPLQITDLEMDVLYITVPPTHGTMEWLTLASLGAEFFRQSEMSWRMRRQARVSALVEHDLQRGRDIQMRLIPQDVKVEGLDVAISFIPCRWVAGDYVDVVSLPKSSKALLVVADVCGKGLPAALVSSSVHTMVHACTRAGASLLGLVTLLNEHLYEYLPANRFVTGIFLLLDTATGEMQFVNAGHPAPIVLSPDRVRRELEVGHYEPLGLTRVRYSFLHDKLEPGQTLVMFSDGLIELRDQSNRMLTCERFGEHLQTLYKDSPGGSAKDLAEGINKVLDGYQGEQLQADDRTLLVVRRLPLAPAKTALRE